VTHPADQLAATWPQLTELEIDGLNILKTTLPSLQSIRAHPENSKMKVKILFLCECCCLHQNHPLLQPYYFKSHGYGPVAGNPVTLKLTVTFGILHLLKALIKHGCYVFQPSFLSLAVLQFG